MAAYARWLKTTIAPRSLPAAKGPPGRMGVNATCCYSLHYFEMISQSPRLIRPPGGGGDVYNFHFVWA